MRKGISKSVRFGIFARDRFTCRYCGKTSEETKLVVDHVIPVSKDGTNDEENLITSCEVCNQGKGAKKLGQFTPTETDRLRVHQEMKEQISAAKAARTAAKARTRLRQEIVDFWCAQSGRDFADNSTISTIVSYVEKHGAPAVFRWIEQAASMTHQASDFRMGRYVSGIRRKIQAETAA